MPIYLGEAFDGTTDGSAVTGNYRSVNQGLSELGHTRHVFLLVGVRFVHQSYREGWEDSQTYSTSITRIEESRRLANFT